MDSYLPILKHGMFVLANVIVGGDQHHHHSGDTPTGCPKTLAECIQTGRYNPGKVGNISAPEQRAICQAVDIPVRPRFVLIFNLNSVTNSFGFVMMLDVYMQPQMLVLLEKLHSFILQGKSECCV